MKLDTSDWAIAECKYHPQNEEEDHLLFILVSSFTASTPSIPAFNFLFALNSFSFSCVCSMCLKLAPFP